MKRLRTAFAVLAIATLPAGAVAVPTTATAASCSTTWGSLNKAGTGSTTAILGTVRAGRHGCFDRLVFDIRGKAPGFNARYVTNVHRAGAGHLLPLRGGAKMEIAIIVQGERHADGSVGWQPPNSDELANVTGFRTFRQVADANSNSAAQFIGLGVRARLPYRIFTLDGPGTGSRVVVDVAHRW